MGERSNLEIKCQLKVRAMPGSRKAAIIGPYGDAWKIRLQAAPEQGKANRELIKLLANVLELPASLIELTGGPASRDKRVTIHGMSAQQVEEILMRGVAK